MMKIGTSGFRGIIGEEFCKENVCRITQSLCEVILKNNLKKEVVVGFDNRFMSEFFAEWVSEVLAKNGIFVRLTSASVPSGLVSFANRLFGNDFSVMITASHNPYYYNGIKIFCKDGQDLDLEWERMIENRLKKVKRYSSLPFEEAIEKGKIEKIDITREYVKSIKKAMKFKDKIWVKTIFNAMNGSSVDAARKLKSELKLDCEIVGVERDVSFNFSSPLPDEERLKAFKKYVVERGVDFAFATDGDGDRLAVIDEKGNYHDGNSICSLLYYFAVKEKGRQGAFVKNFSFSTLADKVCEKLNAEVVQTAIGFKHIAREVARKKAIFGAENSGCEVFEHTSTKDALAVFAMLIEVVNFYEKPLSLIIKTLKEKVGYKLEYKEISFEVKNRKRVERNFAEAKREFFKEVESLDTLDGVKYLFKDGTWLLFRFSGTENLLRLVTEQKSKKEVEEMLDKARNLVIKWSGK